MLKKQLIYTCNTRIFQARLFSYIGLIKTYPLRFQDWLFAKRPAEKNYIKH